MKIKTAELSGIALDWAVAHVIAKEERQLSALRIVTSGIRPIIRLLKDGGNPLGEGRATDFSTDWAQGGPIIEREGIELLCNVTAEEAKKFIEGSHADWRAAKRPINRNARSFGTTPLVAAMRCFVAHKLGEEVEVPDELVAQAETQSLNEPSIDSDQRPRARM